MKRQSGWAIARYVGALIILGATPVAAQIPSPAIDAADTAWMISATGLVLMMSIPGLALFYCGMVRKKNVLATMAQTLVCTFVCSILWAVAGYTLAFGVVPLLQIKPQQSTVDRDHRAGDVARLC